MENAAIITDRVDGFADETAFIEARRVPAFTAQLLRRQTRGIPVRMAIAAHARKVTMTAEERDIEAEKRIAGNRSAQSRADRERVIAASGMSLDLVKRSRVTTVEWHTPSQKLMAQAADSWVSTYPDVPAGRGLCFTGPEGVGKSVTMRRLVAKLLCREPQTVRVVYGFGPAINNRMRAEFRGDYEGLSIQSMLKDYAEVVCICDIFKALPFDMPSWQHDFWADLSDQIEREQRPRLCITANAPAESIKASYKDNNLGWLASRILNAVVCYNIGEDAPNYRQVINGGVS